MTTTIIVRPIQPATIVRSPTTTVVAVPPAPQHVSAPQETTVVVTQPTTSVAVDDRTRDLIVAGTQGPRGPQGSQGPVGPSGGTPLLTSYASAHPAPLTRGMPVAKVNGALRLATAIAPYNEVVGLVFDAQVLQGEVGRVQSGGPLVLTAPEWDAATGMTGGLAPEQTYYLAPGGGMTPFRPADAGQHVAPVGYAVSGTEFLIELGSQIRL